jgi:hypothetical protein
MSPDTNGLVRDLDQHRPLDRNLTNPQPRERVACRFRPSSIRWGRRSVTFVLRDKEAEAAFTCFRCCLLGDVQGCFLIIQLRQHRETARATPTAWKSLMNLENNIRMVSFLLVLGRNCMSKQGNFRAISWSLAPSWGRNLFNRVGDTGQSMTPTASCIREWNTMHTTEQAKTCRLGKK